MFIGRHENVIYYFVNSCIFAHCLRQCCKQHKIFISISLNIFRSFFPWCLHCWIDLHCFIFKTMSTNCQESTRINGREPEKFQANGGRYIPTYVNADVKQYKKDGLQTYIDQLKYEEYEKNKEKWLQNHIAINFNMIHAR